MIYGLNAGAKVCNFGEKNKYLKMFFAPYGAIAEKMSRMCYVRHPCCLHGTRACKPIQRALFDGA